MGAYLDRTVTLTAGQAYSVGNGVAYANEAAAIAAKAALTDEGVFSIWVTCDGGLDSLTIYEKVAGGTAAGENLPASGSGNSVMYVRHLREGWDIILIDAGAGGSARCSVRRVDSDTVADLP